MRRAASTLVSPSLDIFSVHTAKIVSNSMTIPINISGKSEKENVDTPGLLDSGAGGKFIDQNYARKSGFKIQQLEQSLKAFNVDGTENRRGTIKSFVDLDPTIFGKRRNTQLFVTGLGKQKIIEAFTLPHVFQSDSARTPLGLLRIFFG